MRVLGLSSGTSLDAIDVALVDVELRDGTLAVDVLGWSEEEWPNALRANLVSLADGEAPEDPGARIAVLGVQVGEAFAAAARHSLASSPYETESVDLVCSHGQTVRHVVAPDGAVSATLQLGQPAVIAEQIGCTVVADFRPRDVAAGGQGAPLVGFLDALCFVDPLEDVAVLNIGGVANLTFVPHGRAREAIAFDVGPGNGVLDALARRLLGMPFDRDGAVARSGAPHGPLGAELLDGPFFARRPPKSTGREDFGDAYAVELLTRARAAGLNDADVLATASELTAAGIARACARFLPAWPARLYVGGGGTANAALMTALRAALEREAPRSKAAPDIRSVAEAGLPPDAKEAVCFAVLGHETLHGRPNVMSGSTGARHPTVLGAIWPGENYGDLIARVATSGAPGRPVDAIAARVVRGAGMGGTT